MKKTLNNQELLHFCEQFSIILHSGISSLEGLNILADDSTSPQSREIFTALADDLETSGSLTTALENSGLFPSSMTSYVRIGEETGCLDEVMNRLAYHYEQEIEISETIKNAVAYPIAMLGMMGIVIVILLVRVLPVFQQVFRQMGMEMEGISGSLLKAGTTINRYSTVFLVFLAAAICLLLFLFLHPAGRNFLQKTIRRLPYLKEIPLALDYCRLTQGLSMGLRSGLDPDISLELAENLISHPQLLERTHDARKLLAEGELFCDTLTRSGLFEGINARLISIGFSAGATDDVMQKLSDRYQENSFDRILHIVSILEPTIVIIFSLLVGLVLLSVMMPLLGILSEMLV
jgi:type IV pilus assembly protein PilC